MRTIFFIFWLIGATSAGAQAIPVTTKTFADVGIYPQRNAFATVISLNNSRISAEVTARIVEIPVEVGQVVRKGATLARLDSRDYALAAERSSAALDAAQSTHRFAVQQLERARKLVADGFVSPQALNQRETEVSTAAAQLRTAEADLATARRNVQKCLIQAPFRAIIKERLGQVGEIATAELLSHMTDQGDEPVFHIDVHVVEDRVEDVAADLIGDCLGNNLVEVGHRFRWRIAAVSHSSHDGTEDRTQLNSVEPGFQ